MRTVGQILKETREAKLYSLDDVEKQTKIRKELLEALEADDYDKLPPATFIQGFIKNYGRFLNLNAEKLLALFRRDYESKKHPPKVLESFSKPIKETQFTLNPSRGESEKAEKYITQLSNLIDQDRLFVQKTDLSRYDPSAFQDHYRVDVKDYQIEISHSTPNESHNSYVMLFTNLKNVAEGTCEKVILAYVYLNEEQYRKFKEVADDQLERNRRREEEKKFYDALSGFDAALNEVSSGSTSIHSTTSQAAVPESNIPAAVTTPSQSQPLAEDLEVEKKVDEETTASAEIEQTTPTASSIATDDSSFSIRPAQA